MRKTALKYTLEAVDVYGHLVPIFLATFALSARHKTIYSSYRDNFGFFIFFIDIMDKEALCQKRHRPQHCLRLRHR